jgi:hypothetical protein
MGIEREKESGDRLRIVLDVQADAEPISGTIATATGAGEPFTGVMQLVAALDRMRGAEDETAISTEGRP